MIIAVAKSKSTVSKIREALFVRRYPAPDFMSVIWRVTFSIRRDDKNRKLSRRNFSNRSGIIIAQIGEESAKAIFYLTLFGKACSESLGCSTLRSPEDYNIFVLCIMIRKMS